MPIGVLKNYLKISSLALIKENFKVSCLLGIRLKLVQFLCYAFLLCVTFFNPPGEPKIKMESPN